MESPVIRPDNPYTHLRHRRRKASFIYKLMGLTRHGRVSRKKIRTLRVGVSVGLILSVLFGLYLWSLNESSFKQEKHIPPWRKGKPVKPGR